MGRARRGKEAEQEGLLRQLQIRYALDDTPDHDRLDLVSLVAESRLWPCQDMADHGGLRMGCPGSVCVDDTRLWTKPHFDRALNCVPPTVQVRTSDK